MKKSLLVLMSIVGLAGAFGLASCGEVNNKNTKKEAISFNEMYSSSAIAGINVLNINPQVRRAKALTEDDKNKVIENYKIVEGLISDSITRTENEASDREGFDTMYTITITNLDGSKDTYKYYYSEIKDAEAKKAILAEAKEEEEKEDEEDSKEEAKDNDDSKEELEQEEKVNLKGIVIMNDKEYAMTGSRETEKEEDELEVTEVFEIVDPETKEKVVIESENETETEDGKTEVEDEFKLTKYDSKGRRVYEKEMEIENENGELEYELVETINGVKKGYSYEIMTDKDGNKYVEAEITLGKEIIKAEFKVVTDKDGNISYEFSDDASDDEKTDDKSDSEKDATETNK